MRDVSHFFPTIQGMVNQLQRMAVTIPCHPLSETLLCYLHCKTIYKFLLVIVVCPSRTTGRNLGRTNSHFASVPVLLMNKCACCLVCVLVALGDAKSVLIGLVSHKLTSSCVSDMAAVILDRDGRGCCWSGTWCAPWLLLF